MWSIYSYLILNFCIEYQPMLVQAQFSLKQLTNHYADVSITTRDDWQMVVVEDGYADHFFWQPTVMTLYFCGQSRYSWLLPKATTSVKSHKPIFAARGCHFFLVARGHKTFYVTCPDKNRDYGNYINKLCDPWAADSIPISNIEK